MESDEVSDTEEGFSPNANVKYAMERIFSVRKSAKCWRFCDLGARGKSGNFSTKAHHSLSLIHVV